MDRLPPGEWLTRVDEACARGEPAAVRAGLAALLAEIHDEMSRLRDRLAMLSSASFEGLLMHVDGVVIDVNERLCEMHGYSRAEMLGAGTLDRCVAPEDVPEVRRRQAEGLEGAYVATGIRKDGSRFRAEVQSKHERLGDRWVRVVAVRDVTERERMTRLLREGEARFRELTDAAFDITLFSRDGIIVDVRGACERVLGRQPAELIGQPVFAFMAPTSAESARNMIAENRLGFIQVTAVHADGNRIPTEALVVASTLDGQPVRVAGIRDLRPALQLEAERSALEQQVQRSERLHSLGVLAGGIAHDFNNLLTGILGNADFLCEDVSNPIQRQAAQAIVDAARRAAALTRQMLAYAGKRQLDQRERVDVGAVLHETRALMDASLAKNARVSMAIEPGLVVDGDGTMLGQVFINLLSNAADALAGRAGDITVSVRRVAELDERWDHAQGTTVGPGDWVLIKVEDTGIGMAEATRLRIFEPFFTTKESGHGLGLAACLGIVSAHGGAILVESEPGLGSRFSVLLPAVVVPERAAIEAPGAHPTPTRCHVLVVDDEQVVRTQLRRLLELRGYKVTEAAGGLEGLASLERQRPDVMILDLRMPDLDGAEVLRRMRAAGSKLPVVISSAFSSSVLEHLPRDAYEVFLPKPYGTAELLSAVERALAAASGRRGA
jgi:PAS domain S-box-containing protein